MAQLNASSAPGSDWKPFTPTVATVPACHKTLARVPEPVIFAEVNAPQNLSCELQLAPVCEEIASMIATKS